MPAAGGNFNRYWYANNNPYKFNDPDGRNPLGFAVGVGVEIFIQTVVEGKSISEINKSDVLVAGLIGAVAPGAGSAAIRAGKTTVQVAKNVRAIKNLGKQSARTQNRAAKIETRINKNIEEASTAVGDAAGTAGLAATGVVAKKLIQNAVNQTQENRKEEKEPPPSPKEDLKEELKAK